MDKYPFVGACPICSKQMQRNADNTIQCPDEHYRIHESRFDAIWTAYIPVLNGPLSDETSQALLNSLLRENMVKGKKD